MGIQIVVERVKLKVGLMRNVHKSLEILLTQKRFLQIKKKDQCLTMEQIHWMQKNKLNKIDMVTMDSIHLVMVVLLEIEAVVEDLNFILVDFRKNVPAARNFCKIQKWIRVRKFFIYFCEIILCFLIYWFKEKHEEMYRCFTGLNKYLPQ